MPRTFGYAATDEDKKYRKCAGCEGIPDYRVYTTDSSSIVKWMCCFCLFEMYSALGRFIRDVVLPNSDSKKKQTGRRFKDVDQER